MQVDVLGPVRVRPRFDGSSPLMTKERALLAALALNVGQPVRLAELEVALWGEQAPRTAGKSLRSHVARLRRCLGADVIETSGGAYRLAVPPEAVDATRLERALATSSDGELGGGPADARRQLAEAETLWRGEPLTDLADTPERQQQVDRLRELWHRVRDARIQADLDLGHHVSAAAELERLVMDEPLREPLWGLLMLAYYRSGRQVDALRAYRRLQGLLSEEWGVDPSPPLQRLQWQVLQQDPQLDLQPPLPPLHVPAPLSPLVGRTGEVDRLARAQLTHRLVTLHGPAGVGKSRLAQEVARAVRTRFADGVWWVDLTVATDGAGALYRLAETLAVTATRGVPLDEALARYLERRELLLVLDNCEHVAGPLGPTIVAVLQRAPGVRVLATSRVLLRVSGESRWEVPPLGTPEPDANPAEVLGSDAVALFQQRRGRLVSDVAPNTVAEVGRLCRSLDGVPLAVELAAAQAQRLSVHELNERLATEIVGSARQTSAVAHHSSLAAAIDWSYSQLDPTCQRALEWLSVVPGDFDHSAAEAIIRAIPTASTTAGQHCLAILAENSLIEVHPAGQVSRYRLLFVIREFAAARLAERGETETAWHAFTDHYRDLAVRAGPGLNGPHSGTWLPQVTRELLNLRAAVDWSLAHDPPEHTLGLVWAIGRVVWAVPPGVAEDLARLRSAVERADAAGADPDELGWAWQELATSAYLSGDGDFALRACDRADELFTRVGDQAGLSAVCWHRGATHLLATGDLAEAERALRRGQALGERAEAVVPEAWCCAHLGQLHCLAGTQTDETAQLLVRAAALADPKDYQVQAHLLMDWALLHFALREYGRSLLEARRCEQYSRRQGNRSIEQASMVVQAMAMLQQGGVDAARPIALRAARLALDMGNSIQLGLAIQPLARIAEIEGDVDRAARLWGASTARTPVWPAFAPMYAFTETKDRLGALFDEEVTRGAGLDGEQALTLAIG